MNYRCNKIFQATFNLVSLSSLSPDTMRCSAAQRHRLRCRINVIYCSVPLRKGAFPLTNCIFLTSAILMQFKKIISELWSNEIIGWQSPTEPKLGVSGQRNLLFQPFFRGTQYLGRKFSLFASKNTQYRRIRIYLKLHFIHFKEKTWQLKDVQHQLKVLLTFSWLCGQKSAKWTRKLPLGKLTCPTQGEICAQRFTVQRGSERQEKSLSQV